MLAAALAACGPLGRHAATPAPPPARLPVLLVVDAPGVDPALPALAAALLSERIDRPVVVAPDGETNEGALRARLRQYAPLPRSGWSGERCAQARRVVQALAHEGEAHYRLALRRADREREATAAERAAAGTPRRLLAAALHALGASASASVREIRLDGELEATTYRAVPRTRRIPIHHVEARIAPLRRSTPDLRAALAPAIHAVAPPPAPQWDALARTLLARGCRLAAVAVYDARLRHRPRSRDVLRAALRLPRPVPRTERAAPAPAPAAGPRLTCESLCELHIVELCNNDRDLWTRHHQAWRSTPCGQMRGEPFLRACYQRQWLSGTLEQACILPCRSAPEGRARLLQLLQRGGCARTASLPAS